MNVNTFILITVISGLLAGFSLAFMNLYGIEPFIDKALDIEINNLNNSNENVDWEEISSQRDAQKSYSIVVYSLLGLGFSMIFGVVYALSNRFLPLSDDRKKAIIVALILCLTLYIIPFIKYPALPPDPYVTEIKYMKENLYLGYQILSIIITSAMAFLYYRLKNKKKHLPSILIATYILVMIGIYFIFPLNTYEITTPIDLVNSFLVAVVSTMIAFWIILRTVFGLLWTKLNQFKLLN